MIAFDLDWLVWFGAVIAVYLVWLQVAMIWRGFVRIRWYHKLLFRIPIIRTCTDAQLRHGYKEGVLKGATELSKVDGKHRNLSQRKLKRVLARAGIL